MEKQDQTQEWVWVVTETDGDQVNLLALQDELKGAAFIPVFRNKEDGIVGEKGLAKKAGLKYELEAMRLSLVAEAARKNHFEIYIIDHAGTILERYTPMSDA